MYRYVMLYVRTAHNCTFDETFKHVTHNIIYTNILYDNTQSTEVKKKLQVVMVFG